jgi:DNA-binding NarL/FixJ family response regulator
MNSLLVICWYIEDDIVDIECFERVITSLERDVMYCIIKGVSELQEKINRLKKSGTMPDIILSDIHLKDGDGFDCFHLIQENFDITPKYIIFSTSDHPLDLKKAKQVGVHKYIVKPDTFKETAKLLLNIFS